MGQGEGAVGKVNLVWIRTFTHMYGDGREAHMRVNSDETLRRAIDFKEASGGRSWLSLTRDAEQRKRTLAFFSGGRERRDAKR